MEEPELKPELDLHLGAQLDPDLDSKLGEAVDDPQLELDQFGDQDKESSKTMPIGHCNQKEAPGHRNQEESRNNDDEMVASVKEKEEDGGEKEKLENPTGNPDKD